MEGREWGNHALLEYPACEAARALPPAPRLAGLPAHEVTRPITGRRLLAAVAHTDGTAMEGDVRPCRVCFDPGPQGGVALSVGGHTTKLLTVWLQLKDANCAARQGSCRGRVAAEGVEQAVTEEINVHVSREADGDNGGAEIRDSRDSEGQVHVWHRPCHRRRTVGTRPGPRWRSSSRRSPHHDGAAGASHVHHQCRAVALPTGIESARAAAPAISVHVVH